MAASLVKRIQRVLSGGSGATGEVTAKARFRRITESALDAFAYFDDDGEILYDDELQGRYQSSRLQTTDTLNFCISTSCFPPLVDGNIFLQSYPTLPLF